MTEKKELDKHYDAAATESRIYARWLEQKTFTAVPDDRPEDRRYVIMMPLPNVTGALHIGHTMDNVMQDMLVRWHRMRGDNTLWMPGTDHAGIATQAVVEKRLLELEGKTRHDLGRDELTRRIWEWKDEYQRRIILQQQAMGCSCDWDKQRFTMDAVCTRAVREAFYRLFRDGLIYRGYRLVNWDCHLQTAVSDDEIVYETRQGHFWHLRYPLIDPGPNEPEFVTVATTRPETMLGDTAVACHPDPAGALATAAAALTDRLAGAASKDRFALEEELARIETRVNTHLPALEKLRDMARAGKKIRLPLLDREIPLILDAWAKPELGSGLVKITPAHDPNDYQVWQRHSDEIDILNILNADGTLNENAGPYTGLDRFAARQRVVADLETLNLLERIEDRELEIGHSDRSKTPIEPYLSRQWFVRMGDQAGGVLCGAAMPRSFRSAGLAQAAIDAVGDDYRSHSGRRLEFHPDGDRYRNTFSQWLSEKRDWCISRQLWWGHRIPIWHIDLDAEDRDLVNRVRELVQEAAPDSCQAWLSDEDGQIFPLTKTARIGSARIHLLVCPRNEASDARLAPGLEALGLRQDPDVLDTWFSSALWPFSTLGWPEPTTAPVEPGQTPLGDTTGHGDCLGYYYPGSCLVTARDIITLWVARMVIMGLYMLGDLPFTDCFIHANIQDGKGERMSKSKGNGIDPVDIIGKYGTDALRYVLCDMQTGTQDIRLPVQAVSPYTGDLIDLATADHGSSIFTYLCPKSGKEFDVLGTIPTLPRATIISDRFETGRAFCTKLWNAARFALMSLPEAAGEPARFSYGDLELEDRWILTRLDRTVAAVTHHLEDYNPSAAVGIARDFFWSDFCDWYLEMIKPRFRENRSADKAGAVLAYCLDQVLRLLHPFVPFITEAIWEQLTRLRPVRGIDASIPCPGLLTVAAWPTPRPDWRDDQAEADVALLQETVRAIRNWRAETNTPPSRKPDAVFRPLHADKTQIDRISRLIAHHGNLGTVAIQAKFDRPADAAKVLTAGLEIFLLQVVNLEEERKKIRIALDKAEQLRQITEKKLANAGFVERAPQPVVEAERQKLARALQEIELLQKSLADLG